MATLIDSSSRPVVVNVWASWCRPCRAEAPLFEEVSQRFGAEVTFVGLNVRDSQSGARSFIEAFLPDARMAHYFDGSGAVPVALGGTIGVPLTFFFEPGVGLVEFHPGEIDRTELVTGVTSLIPGGTR